MKTEKTNVMRILDQKKISYTSHYYADMEAISGGKIGYQVELSLNELKRILRFEHGDIIVSSE